MAYVFPFFMVAVDNIGSVILFKRGGRMDRDVRRPELLQLAPSTQADWRWRGTQRFNAFIDRKLAASPVPSLIVYPEGPLPAMARLPRRRLHESGGSALPALQGTGACGRPACR